MTPDLSTKSLAWFCKLGRFMAGLDTHPDGPLQPLRTDAPPVAVVSFVPPAVEPLGPIEAAEKKVIMDAIDECDGNVERAARRLDISRGTIYGRLKKWGYTKARENIVKLAGAAMLLIALSANSQERMTQAEIQKQREANERQMELMRVEFAKTLAAAQAQARLREYMRSTGAVAKFDTNKLVPVIPKPNPPYYNREIRTEGFGVHLQAMEKIFPGISTNYTAEQRALTNRTVNRK